MKFLILHNNVYHCGEFSKNESCDELYKFIHKISNDLGESDKLDKLTGDNKVDNIILFTADAKILDPQFPISKYYNDANDSEDIIGLYTSIDDIMVLNALARKPSDLCHQSETDETSSTSEPNETSSIEKTDEAPKNKADENDEQEEHEEENEQEDEECKEDEQENENDRIFAYIGKIFDNIYELKKELNQVVKKQNKQNRLQKIRMVYYCAIICGAVLYVYNNIQVQWRP